ncbi:MAG: tRNA (guanosine(46)-N7)-methyltransferase TrmB [Verrucomicrobiota bacterium]|nr:tRNA (guanosine(46)-N7)-methyltransferase TrmB [Verrucomicrobiota bacterium]
MKTKEDLFIPFSWEERRPIFLERFFYMPKNYEYQEQRFQWAELFGNEKPVHLEICSGNGQWIGERALQQPEVNWVGVELRFDRARKIWLKSFRENIPNLQVICGEGGAFLRCYAPPASVSQVFINFPDPWPKPRHAKHRIIQVPFLEALHAVVRSGGRVTLATDDVPYRDQMISEFSQVKGWKRIEETDWSSYGDSYFANLWKGKGRTIYYLQYEPLPKGRGMIWEEFRTPPKFGCELPGPKGPGFRRPDERLD